MISVTWEVPHVILTCVQADVGLALLSGFGNANVDAKNEDMVGYPP